VSKRLKVAVCMELHWPYMRHHMPNSGIVDYANEHTNWQLEQCSYPEVSMSKGVHYDAIIGRIRPACYEKAMELAIPMVNLWMSSPIKNSLPTVCVDMREAGRMATEHLIARGFKRIVHIGYRNDYSSHLHWQGTKEIAAQYGYPCNNYDLPLTFDENAEDWEHSLSEIQTFQQAWVAPVGLTASTDDLARHFASVLISNGWNIPGELAIVGTGNNKIICNSTHPTLTTISLGYYQSGYQAAQVLDDLLQGKTASREELFIPCKELIVQESSDAYAVDDPYVSKALEYMSNNSNCELSVDHVAKTIGMGRRTLERRFKKEMNRTINEELIRLRIERLKRLLLETDKPVNSLCSEVGFGTNVHMHRTFQRFIGMTPSQFRKKHKKNKFR